MESNDDLEEYKRKLIFQPLNSKEELRDWVYLYFDLYFPMGVVYDTSTHGPIEAMWRIYELFKTNQTKDVPQVVMVASRDSFKTLSAAAIEVLCFVHFRIPIAHAAAIKFQAGACVNYVNSFFRKIRPYLEYHGWTRVSDNKTLIEWRTKEKEDLSLTVLTATRAGMNSRHVPFLILDELDLMDPNAFKESRMVPSVYKEYSPLILILSTRKFASGLMESQIQLTPKIGGEVFKWNIIDVTEKISDEVARINEPKVVRYISTKLPLKNLSPAQFKLLPDEEANKYERIEAYAGIAEHQLLPVMRNLLVDRPKDDKGFLYKPLTATHNNFKVTDIDIADAQLLCNKPSSAGLVYGRFDTVLNTLTPEQALEKLLGHKSPNTSMEFLKDSLMNLGVTFIGGGDWGFTHFTSLVVLAILPNGETWVVDGFLENRIELEDIVKAVKEMQEKWGISRWYLEQAYPAYLVTLRKAGIKCPEFKKVVEDGITALQSRIVDTTNVRRFFVVQQPSTERLSQAFREYKWTIDGKGDVIEGKPYHDKDGVSDIMDSIRYPMQNLFNRSGRIMFSLDHSVDKAKTAPNQPQDLAILAGKANQALMKTKMKELVPDYENSTQAKVIPKKKIFWS